MRWYDKQGELHTPLDITPVRVAVETAVLPPERVAVYVVADRVACLDDDCIAEAGIDDDNGDGALFYTQCEEVTTRIITDRVRAFFLSECDKCGLVWLANPEDEAAFLANDLSDLAPDVFEREFGPPDYVLWHDATDWLEQTYALVLDYGAGWFLRWRDAGRIETAIRYTKYSAEVANPPRRVSKREQSP